MSHAHCAGKWHQLLRNPRASPATTTTTPTLVTNAQLKALIDQGVADALTARDVDISMNGDDSHNSGIGTKDLLSMLLGGLKEWKLCSVLATALWKTKSSLPLVLFLEYCPRGEMKKLEVEMCNLKVKGTDVRHVGGFPDMIHGSVMASKPKTMQDAIEFATELMDKRDPHFC
ncbi:hypothetical protein Tco_1121133 [Tanacetum coccineum]|uniref:Uncharacterized protein n=1 Tax=Tanacetum coccineum TaxID=301880 RepID=A0ABQ5IWW3_9ASTR